MSPKEVTLGFQTQPIPSPQLHSYGQEPSVPHPQSSVTGGEADVRWGPQRAGGGEGVGTPNDDPPPQGPSSQLTNDPLVLKGQASLTAPPPFFQMLLLPGEEKGTQLVSYPPPPSCPGQLVIFTQETTLVSGKWGEQPDPLPVSRPCQLPSPALRSCCPFLTWGGDSWGRG